MSEFSVNIVPYQLQFKRPAGTSRGVYHTHNVWYVVLQSRSNPQHWGVGECAPLHDLSCDFDENYETNLRLFCQELERTQMLDVESLRDFPSILFGLETAMLHYQKNSFLLFDNKFSKSTEGIPINGLIWMGDYDFMFQQIEDKIRQGYRCVKLKIGAINFDDELALLKHIRKHFSSQEITLRVDANGAFGISDALSKLSQLAELDLHSIEQPIKAGQWDEMAELVAKTPLPIALDEELIGVNDVMEKARLLETIKPQYIILKPSLHGGLSGSEEWISIAERLGIDWWITSALESNIALNCIAQWCANFNNLLPQGLGTGSLYTNNIVMPLEIQGDCLWYNAQSKTPTLDNILNLE